MNTGIRRLRGVTLVELLIAVTITLALSALLLSVTENTMKFWRRAQNAFTTDTEAKLLLDTIERDLHAALFRDTGATWLAVNVISTASVLTNHGWRTAGLIKPSTSESLNLVPPSIGGVDSTIADGRFGLSGAWLRFVATNVETKGAGNPGGSQPVMVSYQIARRPLSGSIGASNPATVRYTLFRSAVANDTTLVAGFDVLAAGYASSSSSFPGARSARSITNPNTADAIASNVVDFGVWFYRRNSAGELERTFPVTAADVDHVVSDRSDFPDVADVMVRVLTEEGATAIEAVESGTGVLIPPAGSTFAEWWWSVATTNSRVYVRRIHLKGGPE